MGLETRHEASPVAKTQPMWLSVQYKITAVRHKESLCGKSNLFPKLSIRYWGGGSKRWVRLEDQEIDEYVFYRFRHTHYKDFPGHMMNLVAPGKNSDYDRLEVFMEILREEFDGSIDKLVERIVLDKKLSKKTENEEREDVNRLTLSLVTHGWKAMSVRMPSE